MERDKHGKFVELATKRVNKALDQIRLVGNLSNRMTYEYSEEEAKKILVRSRRRSIRLNRNSATSNGVSDHKFTL